MCVVYHVTQGQTDRCTHINNHCHHHHLHDEQQFTYVRSKFCIVATC